ncbi:MAG TPA: hypothetical protein VMV24_02490 [Candidatus Dormibacteraeota bacterium]|nr:hypothetical protein [Candidatus Dormibacteraeota bacterium]
MSHRIHIKINKVKENSKVDSREYIANTYEPSDGIFQYAPVKPIAMLLRHVDSSKQQFRQIAKRLRNRNS